MYTQIARTLQVCVLALTVLMPALSGADSITLQWDPGSGQIAGYRVYVGTQPGTYTQNVNAGPALTYTFTTAVAGQRYCFVVKSYSSSLESPPSPEVCGYSNAPPALTNPGDRSSNVGQATSLQLAASDPEGRPVTYSATGLPPGLSLMASTGYISGSGTKAGSYRVTATASDGALSSAPQSFTWVMASSTTPPPPSSSVTLSAQPTDGSSLDRVRLTWTTASWSQVWVYRNGTRIAQTANDREYTDYLLRARGAYTYKVCSPNATVCSNNVTVNF
jgi:hypothetical protein